MRAQPVILCALFVGCVVCAYEGRMVLVHPNTTNDCQPGGFCIQPGYSHDCSADDIVIETLALSNFSLKLQYQERGGWIWYCNSPSFLRVSPHGSEIIYEIPNVDNNLIIDWCLAENSTRLFYILQTTTWQSQWPTNTYSIKCYDYEANATVAIALGQNTANQVSYDMIAGAVVYRDGSILVMADPITGATLHLIATPFFSFVGKMFAQNYTVWATVINNGAYAIYRFDFLTLRQTNVVQLAPTYYGFEYGIEFVSTDYSWILWHKMRISNEYTVLITSYNELADGTPVEKSTGIMSFSAFQGIYVFPTTDVSQNQFMIDTASCNLAGRVVNGTCQCDSFNYGPTCGTYCSPSVCLNGYCDYEGNCVCNTGYRKNSTNQCEGYTFPNFPSEFVTTLTLVKNNETVSHLSWKRSQSENAERYDSVDSENVFLLTDVYGSIQTEANGVACSMTVYYASSLNPIIPSNSFYAGVASIGSVEYDVWKSADEQIEVLVGSCQNLENHPFPYMITNYRDGTVQTFNFTNTHVLFNTSWIQIPPFCQDCENDPNYCVSSTPSNTISHTRSSSSSESKYSSISATPSNTVTTGLTPTPTASHTAISISASSSPSPSIYGYAYSPYPTPYGYPSYSYYNPGNSGGTDSAEYWYISIAIVLVVLGICIGMVVVGKVVKNRQESYNSIPLYPEDTEYSIQATGSFVPAPTSAPTYAPVFASAPSFQLAPNGPTLAPTPSYGASTGAVPDDY